MATPKNKIFAIIENTLGLNSGKIDPNANLKDELQLDSVQMVNVAAQVEKELDIELPLAVQEVQTLSGFFDLVEKEIQSKPKS